MNWYEPRVTNFEYWLKDVEMLKREQIAQSSVEPHDTISNVSKRTKGFKAASAATKASSSVPSAARKAAAENGALLAKAAALKDKHALWLQESKL